MASKDNFLTPKTYDFDEKDTKLLEILLNKYLCVSEHSASFSPPRKKKPI